MFFSFIAQAPSPGASGFLSFLPFVLIMVAVYFLMLRPQMKKQKEHSKMVTALRKGDDVVTTGGLHGRIVQAAEKETVVQVQIARGVVVAIERASIAHKTSSSGEIAATESRTTEQRRQKSEATTTSKEIWAGPSSSAVVTSAGRSSLGDASEVTDIASNEPITRKSRHRRFRRRKPNYQPNREATPSVNPPPERSEESGFKS